MVHQSELLDLIQERLSFGRIPHLLLNVDLEKTLLEYKLSEAMNIGLIDLKSFAAVMEQDAEVKLSLGKILVSSLTNITIITKSL